MSTTGIVLFIVFLLVKGLLDKKKEKEKRQRRTQEQVAANIRQAEGEPEILPQEQAQMQALLRRFFPEQLPVHEPSALMQEQLPLVQAAPAAVPPAAEEVRRREMRHREAQAAHEKPAAGALALDLAPAAMLQAVVLAEVLGRPKAQRRRSPYFRP